MFRVKSDEPSDPDGSDPVTWFAELVLSFERGQRRRASEAQAELSRLGWDVSPTLPRRNGDTAPGRRGRR